MPSLQLRKQLTRKVLREGGKAFLSLFDLEKAFDTTEKTVLLQCLYKKGICGRAWRIIKGWYTGAMAGIEIDNTVSELFQQRRGVRQGSALLPTLFLTVMDEILREMCANGAGVSIAGLSFTLALQLTLMTSDPCHKYISDRKSSCLPD